MSDTINRCEIQKRYICTMEKDEPCLLRKTYDSYSDPTYCYWRDWESNSCSNPEAQKTATESTDDPI